MKTSKAKSIIAAFALFAPPLAVGVYLLFNGLGMWWVAILIIVFVSMLFLVFNPAETVETESKFEGLVYGVIADFSICGACTELEVNDIRWVAHTELLRCHQMKRGEALNDSFVQAKNACDFAEFAMLCAKKYANRENNWKLLKYCEDHLTSAHNLTNPFKSRTWMEGN